MNEFIIKKSWFPSWFGHIAQLIISETSDDKYNYISAQQVTFTKLHNVFLY